MSTESHRPVLLAQEEVEIDLDGITCADHAGEQALLSLWQAHRRFVCTSPFARARL